MVYEIYIYRDVTHFGMKVIGQEQVYMSMVVSLIQR